MPIKVFLTVIEGPSKGDTAEFDKGSFMIGRGKADLIINDKKVSGQHCRIHIVGNDCILEDLNSTNGTFVGTRKIQGKAELQNLDEIILGLTKISIAIVEQIDEFKKANTPAPEKSTPKRKPVASEDIEEPSQIATRHSKSGKQAEPELPDPDAEYRTTGVNRINSLIQDEMNTFSKWDHPNVADASESKIKKKQKEGLGVRLIKRKGPEGVSEFDCTKSITIIGRKGSDLKLNDLDCSRQHAQIELTAQSVTVKDLASTNGTFVNGKRISTHELRNGDILQVGQTFFEVFVEGIEE